jgi:hypothetical protein
VVPKESGTELQWTGTQFDIKKGNIVLACTEPDQPLKQTQPIATLIPLLSWGGHATACTEDKKNGDSVVVDTLPLYPALTLHPDTTLSTILPLELVVTPRVFAGHLTAAHEDTKNGAILVAVMLPLKPLSHAQPRGIFMPEEYNGQLTAAHDDI